MRGGKSEGIIKPVTWRLVYLIVVVVCFCNKLEADLCLFFGNSCSWRLIYVIFFVIVAVGGLFWLVIIYTTCASYLVLFMVW